MTEWYVPLKRGFLQEPHGVTYKKASFFRKHNGLEIGRFSLHEPRETHTLLGPLEGAVLNHWAKILALSKGQNIVGVSVS
jgi:hypothetical protein